MSRQRGFTLIELMIVVVIIAILAGLAYPSYTRYVTQARRADGQAAALQLAGQLEKFFTNCSTYSTTVVGGTLTACTGLAQGTGNSPDQHYALTVAAGTTGDIATSYVITATPQGSQANDVDCGALTYNSLGQKGITGPGTVATCWKR